jgi:hypothetical protein
MDRAELGATLRREGINPDTYSLEGRDGIGERYVLARCASGWTVYYTERGIERARRNFDTEDEACRHLLDLLLRLTDNAISARDRTAPTRRGRPRLREMEAGSIAHP